MAYDSSRFRVMLFGGVSPQALESDTWELRGSAWTRRITPRAPPGRSLHAMIYDTARDELVMFGGAGLGYLGDTWVFDGTTWIERTPTISPSPRSNAVMAYHVQRGETLLFGGNDLLQRLDDTWVWNGATWTQQTGPHPAASGEGVMAYDLQRNEIVYYANFETWVWDGAWTQKLPASSPAHATMEAMAYSPQHGHLVMFGGGGATYTWNGSTWQAHSTGTTPPQLYGAAMAVNGVNAIMFGGHDGQLSRTLFGQTWSWGGTDWALENPPAPSPPARAGHAMAYDTYRGQIVMMGARAIRRTRCSPTRGCGPPGRGHSTPRPSSSTLAHCTR